MALQDGQKLRDEGRLPEALHSSGAGSNTPVVFRASINLTHALQQELTLCPTRAEGRRAP